MVLKIRLRQQGRRNRLAYRLVVMDSRARRDGKYVDMLGSYDPHLGDQKELSLYEERISHWLDKGAQLSEKAEALVARGAPSIIKGLREKERAKQVKQSKKRRKK